jgi:hypothetical protein
MFWNSIRPALIGQQHCPLSSQKAQLNAAHTMTTRAGSQPLKESPGPLE